MSKGKSYGEAEKPEVKASVVKRGYGDFLDVYKGVSETGTNIVKQAAEVMESEMANVIRVAKQLEQESFVGERVRTEKPDELIQKFRRDVHEVLDIFVDVFSVAVISMSKAGNVITVRGGAAPKAGEMGTAARPVITAPQSVKAGEISEFPISFENSGNVETDEFKLYSTDLISDSGARIPASQVEFMPTSLKIPPHQTTKVLVTVSVLKDTPSGTYTGLVLAANLNQLRTEITLKVE